MRQSFKLFFQQPLKQVDIRRVAVAVPPPSWEEFLALLEQIYGDKFHPELSVQYKDDEAEMVTVGSQIEWEEALTVFEGQQIVKIFVTAHPNRNYFKDSPPPRAERFYEKAERSNEEKAPALPADFLRDLASSVPKVLQSFFKKGKILPHNVPAWLQDAVKIKHVGEGDDDVELDVDVDKLYKVLLDKAISFLNEGMYDKAKNLFEQLLVLNRNNPLTLYNLACAESLKGEVKDALEHLKQAIENGYSNFQHMLADPDLKNLKLEPDFDALLNQLKSRFGFQHEEAQTLEQEEQKEEVEQQEFEEQKPVEQLLELEAPSDSDSETDTDASFESDEEEQEIEVVPQPEEQSAEAYQDLPELVESSDTEPSDPEPSEEAKKYVQQIQQLVDMGFSNIENNETLLIAADGDIDSVIATLLDGFVAL